jgi:hypothetical protein
MSLFELRQFGREGAVRHRRAGIDVVGELRAGAPPAAVVARELP